jgi:hypothetical protein
MRMNGTFPIHVRRMFRVLLLPMCAETVCRAAIAPRITYTARDHSAPLNATLISLAVLILVAGIASMLLIAWCVLQSRPRP